MALFYVDVNVTAAIEADSEEAAWQKAEYTNHFDDVVAASVQAVRKEKEAAMDRQSKRGPD